MRSDARRATLRPIKPAALLLAGLAAASPALAQTGAGFPNRPLKIVVPFPAGGPVDLTARTLAQKLAATLGQSVVVDNRAGAATNAQAFALFDAIGRPEFKEDPRFNSVQARFANVKDYYASRVEALKAKTTAEWLEIFDKADIPAMPYHTPDSVLDDPHLNDVGFFEWRQHPTEGKIRMMRLPNKWSCGARKDWNPAPKLGQQSVEILKEIGLDNGEIDAMIRSGATTDGRLNK